MATPAQQLANSANARLSTGPRTAEGKARSAQNARSHGLTSRDLVVTDEDRPEFEQLLADFQAEVRPEGPVQQTLFEELTGAAWNLRRVRRLEAELCAQAAASLLDLLNDESLQRKLDNLARHKTRIERTFHRSLKELKALQTSAVLAATLPRLLRETTPPLASASEIAKRTQSRPATLIKNLVEAIDHEADALTSAALARRRLKEMEVGAA